MPDDLIARLRADYTMYLEDENMNVDSLLEAADELERKDALLDAIRRTCDTCDWPNVVGSLKAELAKARMRLEEDQQTIETQRAQYAHIALKAATLQRERDEALEALQDITRPQGVWHGEDYDKAVPSKKYYRSCLDWVIERAERALKGGADGE